MDKREDIRNLVVNPENPRTLSEFMEGKLIESILVFPKMLEVRPIIINKEKVVLGGNMRLSMLLKIAEMDDDEIENYMFNQKKYRLMSADDKKELHDFWKAFKENPVVPYRKAEDLTLNEEREFLVKDNLHYGEDDVSVLKKNFDKELIEDIIGSVPWNLYDYGDKMNDDNLDIKPVKSLQFRCGYVVSVITQEEYVNIQKSLDEYLETHQYTDGYLGYLLGIND